MSPLVRSLLVLLVLVPPASASQPLADLEATYATEGTPRVGEPFTLRIRYVANADVDETHRLHVPVLVRAEGPVSWRVELSKGETLVHEVRLVATRAAYWSAAIAREGEVPRGYVLDVRSDLDGGAAVAFPDQSFEVIAQREVLLGLTARGVNATAYEATYFAAKSGLWRVDEAIAVSLDAGAVAVSEGPRVDGATTEDIGPNTYAMRALRAFVVARFERPAIEAPLQDPSRMVKCEDFSFRTEDGAFRYESRGVQDCAGLASAMSPLPALSLAFVVLALVLALALVRR